MTSSLIFCHIKRKRVAYGDRDNSTLATSSNGSIVLHDYSVNIIEMCLADKLLANERLMDLEMASLSRS